MIFGTRTASRPASRTPEAPETALPEGAASGSASQGGAKLTALEAEVIDVFVQLSRVLGLPRSMAEIYGLLYISPRPLNMENLVVRLGLSKGSASQGLKFLRNAGAVETLHVPDDRRAHYRAVAQLRKLAARFLSKQVMPQLQSGQERLERLSAMARKLPAAERGHASARIAMLQSWRKRSHRFLPVMLKMMGD